MSETMITEIREKLIANGGVTLTGPNGKTLYLVLNRNFGVAEEGILIAYEGQGAHFFALDRPLNGFRLMQSGFSLLLANQTADLVNAILGAETTENTPSTVKLLTTLKDN